MKRVLHAALLWIACLALPVSAQEGAIVKTSHGTLAGQVLDDGSRVFRGVPYAAPPVGAARWRPPASVADWTGTHDAAHFGPACMQPLSSATSIYASDLPAMSEDCLTLNIWAPEVARKAAVMVWLHGGSLVSGHGGSPFFDGARLAREGVIVVTINYRLGVFGFLAHPELSAENRLFMRRAIMASSIRSRRSNGSAATSRRSAAIPRMSPSSANSPARSAWLIFSPVPWPRACFTRRSRKAPI